MLTGHTFTSCGVTGREGPTEVQMRAAYNTVWDDQYLSQGAFQGYQDWTVPISGDYKFDVKGASGYVESTGAGDVGRGARISGTISLNKGEIITIVVGQMGEPGNGSIYGGSGGGTFVVRKNGNIPLIVAGGGSANTNSTADALRQGKDGQLTIRGGTGRSTNSFGDNGFGGPASGGYTGGGGGFSSNGQNGSRAAGGGSFLSGLTAPVATSITTNSGGAGGFGGAGNSYGQAAQSGGAGGYSGGSGSQTNTTTYTGGGGGSYISSLVTDVATSDGTYEELSIFPAINGDPITNLNSYNYGDGSVAVTLVSEFSTGNTVHASPEDAADGINAIAIEPAGNSYHALIPISYDIQNDVIYSVTPHGFEQDQAVSFEFLTPTSDIIEDEVYYINKVDDYTYGLIYDPAVSFTVPSGRSTSDIVKRIVINTDLNTFNLPNHGFTVDQPLQYSAGEGTPIEPLQDLETYYVAEVIDADNFTLKLGLEDTQPVIDLTSAGTGTEHSFIFLTVNFVADTLYIPDHNLVSGQKVLYSNNGGDDVGGLTNGEFYYVFKIDNSTIKLTTDAALENFVNLSDVGTGTHSLVIYALDYDNDIITIPDHGFRTGELVEYDARGLTEIDGLTSNQQYYVIVVDKDNLKLATTAGNAEDDIAIDITDTPAGVGRHTLTSLTQTPDGIYEIVSIPSDDTFVVEARGQVPDLFKAINPRATVDVELDALFVESHGFITGTGVLYDAGDDGTAIGGLTDNTTYYVVAINQDYFRLAESVEAALSGSYITLTDFGTGLSHSLTTNQLNGRVVGSGNVSVDAGSVLVNGVGTSFSKILKVGDNFTLYPANTTTSLTFSDAVVNTSNNRIEIAHPFTTGDIVKFDTGGGVAPTPLLNDYYYYVGVIDETNFQIYPSKDAAELGSGFITFSSSGTGSNFSLTNTVPKTPIVRRITAVGSDTQITVDKPYSEEYVEVDYAYPTFIYVRPSGYSLHRPFDGGVEMSVGADNSYGQIIRQTRKYFRYQSGKGIQTSFAINFKPSVDIEYLEKFGDRTVIVKTRRPHNVITGRFIEVNDALDSEGNLSTLYNGQFQVTRIDDNRFTFNIGQVVPSGTESRAYGFPQFHVTSWTNGAIRSGMFDFQNGMFFEFDGQKLYCVRRSSTQQTAGTVSALRGSELIFGEGTRFTTQFSEGDSIVMRGQTYKVIDVESDTRLSIRPEYRGSTGLEIEFNPQTAVNTSTNVFTITRHGLSDKLPVIYNSIDGEQIGGLINGSTYYVDIIDANNFRLLATPDAGTNVVLSSTGTTNLHSFLPAKSGIIITKTVDTKIPQEEWNIDTCDGTGPSGYDLDLSRIQMCYMDYSWYGAGKIRFGFKAKDGLVRYVHEFKHNNVLFESYFRSGNLPARYEVTTDLNPTYIPSLFHWGTSVIMDGTFDDDRGYLFTASSQTLEISGTTTKSFAANSIDLDTGLVTSLTHGFNTGDVVEFQSLAADGFPGDNNENPTTQVVGENTFANLTNNEKYKLLVNSPDRIHLVPNTADIYTFNDFDGGIRTQQDGAIVTVTAKDHGLTTGDFVGLYGSTRVTNGAFPITVLDTDTFSYDIFESAEFTSAGSYTWTAPAGVTEVSVVAVGAGGGGSAGAGGAFGAGGGGGGLGWKYRIPVTPGEEYDVVVGAGGTRDTGATGTNNATNGGSSYFIDLSTVAGLGGSRGDNATGGAGGSYVGDGGGAGGRGGNVSGTADSGGGGGAGGYTGNGGRGGDTDGAGQDGQGGGGGGAGSGDNDDGSGGGGGVGIDGAGANGLGSPDPGDADSAGGGGGSGGADGGAGGPGLGEGGLYGGGGGGAENNTEAGPGADGAVKIIWGSTTYPDTGSQVVADGPDQSAVFAEVINFLDQGNIQYTYFLYPEGSLNNTTGPNYQPLISLRLSPSVDSGLTGKLGDRDIINRMQVRMREIGVSTNELVEVKLILNGRLNNLAFKGVAQPSLIELVEHTPQDTISGGVQVYNFQAEGGTNGDKATTTVNIDTLFELSNSILGGDNIFPDGPDILTVAVSRLTGNSTRTSAKLSWGEAQA